MPISSINSLNNIILRSLNLILFNRSFLRNHVLPNCCFKRHLFIEIWFPLNKTFGTSIKLGCDHKHNNSPIVKIRSGQRTDYDAFLKESPLRPVKEDIDKDANSIYLSTSGTYSLSNPNGNITSPNILFGERPNRNKIFNQIIMNSDKLVFNARKENIQIKAAGILPLAIQFT